MQDSTWIENLFLTVNLPSTLWPAKDPSRPLPVLLSFDFVHSDTSLIAHSDDLAQSPSDYSALSNLFIQTAAANSFPSLSSLGDHMCSLALFNRHISGPVNIRLSHLRALKFGHPSTLTWSATRGRQDYHSFPSKTTPERNLGTTNRSQDCWSFRGLTVSTIIGLRDHEREEEQDVILDIDVWQTEKSRDFAQHMQDLDFRSIAVSVSKYVKSLSPLTLESLCLSVTKFLVSPTNTQWDVDRSRVKITKPSAILWSLPMTSVSSSSPGSAVQMYRTRQELFPRLPRSRTSASMSSNDLSVLSPKATNSRDKKVEAFIAIGTNLGDRYENINRALKVLDTDTTILKVEETSALYESEPMYVVDQPRFLNAVLKVSTTLSPPELLARLKTIERSLGRPTPSRPSSPISEHSYIPNGPRVLDLDILLYANERFQLHTDELDEAGNEMWLKIPHARMTEREFVLRPLADIVPDRQIEVLENRSPSDLLIQVLKGSAPSLTRYVPLHASEPPNLSFSLPPKRTLLMSIVNLTPDSFSDGSPSQYLDLDRNLQICLQHIADGADILDLGGYSTRPNANDVSEKEELERVLPLVQRLRSEGVRIPLSVDTFRASVARECIKAGANIINDVTGGQGDPDMLQTIKELDCPVILMHMRGTPKTMGQLSDYNQEGGIVRGVRKELAERVRDAINAGVKRWNIIIDPGLGFAKGNAESSIHLIRNLAEAVGRTEDAKLDKDAQLLSGIPVLFAPSRKRFLGEIIGRPRGQPKDRDWATAAVISAVIGSGATEIVRVHEIKGIRDVLAVADEIYRVR